MVLRSIHFIASWSSSVNEEASISLGNKEKNRLTRQCKDVLMTAVFINTRNTELMCGTYTKTAYKNVLNGFEDGWKSFLSLFLITFNNFQIILFVLKSRDSSVGIAPRYRPVIESRWGGEIFRSCPDRPWGPHSLLYNGYRISFPGQNGWGVNLTAHPI